VQSACELPADARAERNTGRPSPGCWVRRDAAAMGGWRGSLVGDVPMPAAMPAASSQMGALSPLMSPSPILR
jgi:hypothetical protein